MRGWLIYNGSLEVKKVNILVNKLKQEADRLGFDLSLVKTTDILPYYDENCRPKIALLSDQPKCDYIIFWDKDVLLAKHLGIMGHAVFNSSDAIAKCDDKLLMHQALTNSGIPTPNTMIGPFAFFKNELDLNHYKGVVDLLGEDFIIKEACGSFGMQVYMINSFEQYISKINELGNKRFLMQENIKSSRGRDLRINIIGDKIIGAMERINTTDFRANITLGGSGRPVEINEKQREIALKAHKCLGLDFSGVDLLYDENEDPILCEVNSNVNYISYEDVSGLNISKLLLEYIEGSLQK